MELGQHVHYVQPIARYAAARPCVAHVTRLLILTQMDNVYPLVKTDITQISQQELVCNAHQIV